jgi:Holliday junction resolvasome RuvABC ATP-dependent DNA helicase subunit
LQIDEFGLDATDRRYLAVLAGYGSAPLNALSAKLDLPPQTLYRVIEPYLIRMDLVTKGKSSARVITERGRRYIESTAWPVQG